MVLKSNHLSRINEISFYFRVIKSHIKRRSAVKPKAGAVVIDRKKSNKSEILFVLCLVHHNNGVRLNNNDKLTFRRRNGKITWETASSLRSLSENTTIIHKIVKN